VHRGGYDPSTLLAALALWTSSSRDPCAPTTDSASAPRSTP